MTIKAVRGMHDLFGEEITAWHFVEKRLTTLLENFGYREIRTPVLEQLEVFKETVGDETDIVEKQMYTIVKESETLVLRPEGTAGFIRAVIEHQLHRLPDGGRYYYYQPMFRHERPQKGRLRQFFQFGAEIINDPSPEADAEIIVLLDQIYKTFNLSEYEIRINSVGCTVCRPIYREKLKNYFQPHLSSLCELCQKRFERSPLRILDCKRESCQSIAKLAPLITDSLCSDCQTHHTQLRKRLGSAGVTFLDDPTIVRGLDYYTRTAFEFTSSLLGAQSALGGGGRYDGISTRFGESPFPAVGFGLGMERLMLALQEKGVLPQSVDVPAVFLAPMGEDAFDLLYSLSLSLRRKGVWAEMNYDVKKGLKSLLKQANRMKAPFVLMLGEDELKKKEFVWKDMIHGTQESLPLSEIEDIILSRRKRE